jgi:hypothetical protein
MQTAAMRRPFGRPGSCRSGSIEASGWPLWAQFAYTEQLRHVEGDNVVKPKELYATEMEREIDSRFATFDDLEALYASRQQPRTRLQNNNWMEGHLNSEVEVQTFSHGTTLESI